MTRTRAECIAAAAAVLAISYTDPDEAAAIRAGRAKSASPAGGDLRPAGGRGFQTAAVRLPRAVRAGSSPHLDQEAS